MKHPFAITLDVGTSKLNQTGSWRTQRPVYVDRLPPCNHACPAGENIQGWLSHAESGDYEDAWRALTENNPLPAVMGRVCYHPCETACNRAQIDEAVGINAVERFLGDVAIGKGWNFDKPKSETGKRVLVVGAGPSGLSAAYHLRRLGHAVTIREAGPLAGGMMRFGIPKYRLPRDVLDAEIGRIVDMGVELELNAKVDDIEAADARGRLRRGLPRRRRAYRQARLYSGRRGGQDSRCRQPPALDGGRRTAAARPRSWSTAAATPRSTPPAPPSASAPTEAIIVYRRTREKMPAHDFEVEEALQEGVTMKWLSTIKSVDDGTLTVEKMKLDDTGFPQPTGEFETLEADSLVLALGQDVDLSSARGVPGMAIKDGMVKVGPGHDDRPCRAFSPAATWFPRSARSPSRSATARRPRATSTPGCSGRRYAPPPKHELASFDRLNTWYYADAPGDGAARCSTPSAGSRLSRRSSAGSTRPTRSTRRAAACPAAIASNATIATASAPTMR